MLRSLYSKLDHFILADLSMGNGCKWMRYAIELRLRISIPNLWCRNIVFRPDPSEAIPAEQTPATGPEKCDLFVRDRPALQRLID
jgi:hypothetical protein